jgi:hypothetical protein
MVMDKAGLVKFVSFERFLESNVEFIINILAMSHTIGGMRFMVNSLNKLVNILCFRACLKFYQLALFGSIIKI